MGRLIVVPGTCSDCGCTEDEACIGGDGRPCIWVDPDRTLCSECAGDEEVDDAEL